MREVVSIYRVESVLTVGWIRTAMDPFYLRLQHSWASNFVQSDKTFTLSSSGVRFMHQRGGKILAFDPTKLGAREPFRRVIDLAHIRLFGVTVFMCSIVKYPTRIFDSDRLPCEFNTDRPS